MPETAKRVVFRPDGRVEIESFRPKEPGRGEVLIETVCTLISAGTELAILDGGGGDRYPGYCNVGRVIETGEGVSELRPGDLVATLGGHATHVTAPAAPEAALPVPQGVSPPQASFTVLGSVSLYGIHRAEPVTGEHVAIPGMGVVGQLALQFASRAGCETLTAVDPVEGRLRAASRHGATHALNPGQDDLTACFDDITGGAGLDCVIEASGHPEVLPDFLKACRIGGRILLLGSPFERTAELRLHPVHVKELTITGVHQPKCPITPTPRWPWTKRHNRKQVLKMIEDGRLRVDSLITHVLPFTEAAEAYRLVREDKEHALGVVLDFQGGL